MSGLVGQTNNSQTLIGTISYSNRGPKGDPGSQYQYTAGDNISISADYTISVITTNNAEQDNTKPITSGGVHTIVGNIEVLLESI